MFEQRVFHQILSEVRELTPYIQLKLPASRSSVQQQMGYLITAQTRLEAMQQRLMALLKRSDNPKIQRLGQMLLRIVQELSRDARELKLLAEEYPVDPEGAASCLESRKSKQQDILQWLESAGKPQKGHNIAAKQFASQSLLTAKC
ncbi:MAG: hypothetical protein KME16_05015 [Scytolyngbya sp. HA4215-MV1]|jgi:hypothetical protein|nr:hypothetical protein [Scytolyngbya sp. HA4215-MV1]